jgi:hypothetical protein
LVHRDKKIFSKGILLRNLREAKERTETISIHRSHIDSPKFHPKLIKVPDLRVSVFRASCYLRLILFLGQVGFILLLDFRCRGLHYLPLSVPNTLLL